MLFVSVTIGCFHYIIHTFTAMRLSTIDRQQTIYREQSRKCNAMGDRCAQNVLKSNITDILGNLEIPARGFFLKGP